MVELTSNDITILVNYEETEYDNRELMDRNNNKDTIDWETFASVALKCS